MNDYTIWVTKRDDRNEALRNAANKSLARQARAANPENKTSALPTVARMFSHAGVFTTILVALLGRR
jgi:hypothetical protein